MTEVMTRIELGGVLGRTFGKVHYRSISRTQEACRALAATLKGFESFMISSKRRGLTFSVFRGKTNLGFEELSYPVTGETIKIMPVVIGSKRSGLFQTIIGAVLVVVGVAISYFTGGTASAVGAGIAKFGGAMLIGGVIQMLSPQPPGLAHKDDADNAPSYAFGPAVNTAAQGYPVPLLYGQRRIGGAVISAGIYIEDQQ